MAFQNNVKFTEKKIIDFKAGDNVTGYFYVKESELKVTTTNNKYMNFTFADTTGEVNAKLWDFDETNATRFPAGIVVKARGNILDWQGQMQFKIDLMRRTNEDDHVNVSDLVPSAPETGETMLGYIVSVIATMKNDALKAVANKVIDVYREDLLIYPAAKKNHHAVRSGLLYHTSTMLKMGEAYAQVYPKLDRDLLLTGVMIHDIGKIKEMEISELGLVTDYSTEGILLGHIVQGIKIIDNICDELGTDSEIKIMLEHMILSHHYEPEYGSPKYPMFPEAEVLHYLDITDARLYDMFRAKEMSDPGKFSERIKSMENREIYRSVFEENQG